MATKDKQKKARETYRKKAEVKTAYAKYQKENYKNVSATFKRSEAVQIYAIFSAHGVKLAEVLRGAAFALMNGEQIPTRSEPLPSPDNSKENENPD